jgi:tetratricopeptide (TPR) repeat protein
VETLYRLGWVATQLGDYEEAAQLYQQSLSLAKELGRQEIVTDCLLELGYVCWVLEDYQAAERHCRESISVSIEIGYHDQIALAYRYLARIAVGRSDYQSAKKHLGDSLAILILNHPAGWPWSKDSMTPLHAGLEAGLSPGVVTAGREWGSGKTLQEAVEELLS